MKSLQMFALCLASVSVFGCAMAGAPVNGGIYSDVKGPIGATEASGGSSVGESCAASYLGFVAVGDASIESAKKAGSISTVTAVDHHSFSILGVYARFCTLVYGK